MKFEETEPRRTTKELLPKIIGRIFAVCKTDQHFPLKEQINHVDNSILILKSKLIKQNKLYEQSRTLTKELDERTRILEDRNSTLKEQLLESLGSEL
jgi:hypothetical protein